jgi:hypothetical protein
MLAKANKMVNYLHAWELTIQTMTVKKNICSELQNVVYALLFIYKI